MDFHSYPEMQTSINLPPDNHHVSILGAMHSAGKFTDFQMFLITNYARMVSNMCDVEIPFVSTEWSDVMHSNIAPIVTTIMCPNATCKRPLDPKLHQQSKSCPYCQQPTRWESGVPLEMQARIPIFNWLQLLCEDPTFWLSITSPPLPDTPGLINGL